MQIFSCGYKENIVIDRGTEAKDTQGYAIRFPVFLQKK